MRCGNGMHTSSRSLTAARQFFVVVQRERGEMVKKVV